jgi:hypothetical protein
MKRFLVCATLWFLSTPGLADATFKTCSGAHQENATVTLDDTGAFHVVLTLGKERFVSSTCKPVIPSPSQPTGIVSIECSGEWSRGRGSVILGSMDGVLNVLMYKGPEPLPSQYDDDTPLFCGAPNR